MNLCKLYRENAGRKIKVHMIDGEIFIGVFEGYVSALDNEPERESILVDNTELYTDEIGHVDILA